MKSQIKCHHILKEKPLSGDSKDMNPHLAILLTRHVSKSTDLDFIVQVSVSHL